MLILLDEICPEIAQDLRYATKDNFTQKILYPSAHCLLQKEVALALKNVQKQAEKLGLGLKVWDGYRPLHVQWMLWEHTPDERFVAHPEKGGKHPRGTAVDLTLIDANGDELQMPTLFDDFTEKAHRCFQDLSPQEIGNRDLLQSLMENEGFIGLPNEWWHFDYHSWASFEPHDQTFGEIL